MKIVNKWLKLDKFMSVIWLTYFVMVHWLWKILEPPQRNILEVFYMERSKELSVWNTPSKIPWNWIIYLIFAFSVFSGMVTSLPPDFFSFLSDLQRNLCRVIKFVGRIDHDFWRSFMNERKTEAMEVYWIFFFTNWNFSVENMWLHFAPFLK